MFNFFKRKFPDQRRIPTFDPSTFVLPSAPIAVFNYFNYHIRLYSSGKPIPEDIISNDPKLSKENPELYLARAAVEILSKLNPNFFNTVQSVAAQGRQESKPLPFSEKHYQLSTIGRNFNTEFNIEFNTDLFLSTVNPSYYALAELAVHKRIDISDKEARNFDDVIEKFRNILLFQSFCQEYFPNYTIGTQRFVNSMIQLPTQSLHVNANNVFDLLNNAVVLYTKEKHIEPRANSKILNPLRSLPKLELRKEPPSLLAPFQLPNINENDFLTRDIETYWHDVDIESSGNNLTSDTFLRLLKPFANFFQNYGYQYRQRGTDGIMVVVMTVYGEDAFLCNLDQNYADLFKFVTLKRQFGKKPDDFIGYWNLEKLVSRFKNILLFKSFVSEYFPLYAIKVQWLVAQFLGFSDLRKMKEFKEIEGTIDIIMADRRNNRAENRAEQRTYEQIFGLPQLGEGQIDSAIIRKRENIEKFKQLILSLEKRVVDEATGEKTKPAGGGFERLEKFLEFRKIFPSEFGSSGDADALLIVARQKYIVNLSRSILPNFHFSAICGARVFDDQSLAGGVMLDSDIQAFLLGTRNQNSPSYHDIYNKFNQVYIQTRNEFFTLRDPMDDTTHRKLFLNMAGSRPASSSSTSSSSAASAEQTRIIALFDKVIAGIRESDTFEKYLKFREKLYTELLYPVHHISYAELKNMYSCYFYHPPSLPPSSP